MTPSPASPTSSKQRHRPVHEGHGACSRNAAFRAARSRSSTGSARTMRPSTCSRTRRSAQGIKEYSEWPTIPQLYVKGEFVGGSDIMMEMFESGELQQLLGAESLKRGRGGAAGPENRCDRPFVGVEPSGRDNSSNGRANSKKRQISASFLRRRRKSDRAHCVKFSDRIAASRCLALCAAARLEPAHEPHDPDLAAAGPQAVLRPDPELVGGRRRRAHLFAAQAAAHPRIDAAPPSDDHPRRARRSRSRKAGRSR